MGISIYSGNQIISGSSSSGGSLTPEQESLINSIPNKANKTEIPDISNLATQSEVNNKVDKDGTKILSDENYSTTEKNQVAYLWEHKDDSIDTSTLATKTELSGKADTTHTHVITDVTGLSDKFDDYYTKLETLSKSEIQNLISAVNTNRTWKDSVDTIANLPLSGNTEGDARTITSTGELCIWSNNTWVNIGNATLTDIATESANGLMSKEMVAKLNSIVLDNLATKTELSNKADINHTHSDYAKTSDISNFVTYTDIDNRIDTKLVDYSTTTQNDSKYISMGNLIAGSNINIKDEGYSYRIN